MPQIVCDNIDRLITVEMRRKGILRGIIAELYNAARGSLGNKPLTYLAATGRNRRPSGCGGFGQDFKYVLQTSHNYNHRRGFD